MTAPRVDLRIEQLVLHGFEGVDPAAVGDAVAAELARLISEGGRSVPPTSPSSVSEAVAARVAQAVYRRIPGTSSR